MARTLPPFGALASSGLTRGLEALNWVIGAAAGRLLLDVRSNLMVGDALVPGANKPAHPG
jgi:hypothetical protein